MNEKEELNALRAFKAYMDDLYGQGLEVSNWHQNGDTEPFDSFYEDAVAEYEKGASPLEAEAKLPDFTQKMLYEKYCERFKKEIDDITLTDTEALYENSDLSQSATFNEYVSNYGYSNGLTPFTFDEYMERVYPLDSLADDIEQYMYERGEYDFQPDDTIRWITSADRDVTTEAVRNSLENNPYPLVNYFVAEDASIVEEDELREQTEDFLDRIKTVTGVGKDMDYHYQDYLALVDACIEAGFLQEDPCKKGNILIYREAGETSPEGWHSEPKTSVANDLVNDKEGQDTLTKALCERRLELATEGVLQSSSINAPNGNPCWTVDFNNGRSLTIEHVQDGKTFPNQYYKGELYVSSEELLAMDDVTKEATGGINSVFEMKNEAEVQKVIQKICEVDKTAVTVYDCAEIELSKEQLSPLDEIISNHQHWLKQDCEGWENMKADLSYTDLRGTDLSNAKLSHAELSHAELSYADLHGANLSGTNLSGANLSNTIFDETVTIKKGIELQKDNIERD